MAKDNTGILIVILIVITVAAGLYIFLSSPETAVQDNYQYSNGQQIFNVTKVNDIETYITLYIGKDEMPYIIGLRNDPLSLEDIIVDGAVNTRIINDDIVYVTINPNANLTSKTTIAALEIDKIIDNDYLYGITVSSAMTLPNDYGYPEVSCYDGTDSQTVIFLTLGDETKVYTDEYCIIIVGTDEDNLIRATDRFIYQLLGIMV